MHDSGIDIAVATPHFYPHIYSPTEFHKMTNAALRRLSEVNIERAPKLCAGAEVLLCENIDQLEDLDLLCIRGTNILLLELPTGELSGPHFRTVRNLVESKYTIVLAHIDRYLKEHPEYIFEFLDMGALAQINPLAVAPFGPKKLIMHLLENKKSIVAVGSDLHGAKKASMTKFTKLIKGLGSHYTDIQERSAALLKNAEIFDFTKKD
jgi:protein-tyrosine phosphatase